MDDAAEMYGGSAVDEAAALGVCLVRTWDAVALAFGDGRDVEAGVE